MQVRKQKKNQLNKTSSMKSYVDKDGIERLQLEKLLKSHFALLKKCKMGRVRRLKRVKLTMRQKREYFFFVGSKETGVG